MGRRSRTGAPRSRWGRSSRSRSRGLPWGTGFGIRATEPLRRPCRSGRSPPPAWRGVVWAYEGWQNVTNSAGEAQDPQRTFARGIGLGTAALVTIYLTANAGYVAAVGASGVSASDRIAARIAA